ncbi:Efflux pump membrane transporter BepE [compost metagenome]
MDDTDLSVSDCVMAYRAYLPNVLQQLHPYVAPLKSRRLRRLPPTLIVNAAHDLCQSEGKAYATELMAAENMLYMSSQAASDGVMTLTVTFKLGTDPDLATQLDDTTAIALPILTTVRHLVIRLGGLQRRLPRYLMSR